MPSPLSDSTFTSTPRSTQSSLRTSSRPVPGSAGLRASSPFFFSTHPASSTNSSTTPDSIITPQGLPSTTHPHHISPSTTSSRGAQDTPLQHHRRGQFLRKVRAHRDEDRWSARAEVLSRIDRAEWARERRREQELALLDAPPDASALDVEAEENFGLRGSSATAWDRQGHGHAGQSEGQAPLGPEGGSRSDLLVVPDEQEEVERLLRLEEMELDALVDMMHDDGGARSGFGSDDEEYDALFEEMLERDRAGRETSGQGTGEEDVEMNMGC